MREVACRKYETNLFHCSKVSASGFSGVENVNSSEALFSEILKAPPCGGPLSSSTRGVINTIYSLD